MDIGLDDEDVEERELADDDDAVLRELGAEAFDVGGLRMRGVSTGLIPPCRQEGGRRKMGVVSFEDTHGVQDEDVLGGEGTGDAGEGGEDVGEAHCERCFWGSCREET